MLVDHEHVGDLQEFGHGRALPDRRHRGEVPDDLHPRPARPGGDLQVLRDGDFHLQHEHGGLGQEVVRQIGGAQGHIGAARHGDRVLAAAVDGDEGAAGRLVRHPDGTDIDTVLFEILTAGLTERILADGARHGYPDRAAMAYPRRRDGLIGALAAEETVGPARQDSFARTGDPLHPGDEIHIDGAEDDDHGTALF